MDGGWVTYEVQSQADLRRARWTPGIRTRYDKNGANEGKSAVDTSVRSVETYEADIGVGAEVQGESDKRVRCRRRAERIRWTRKVRKKYKSFETVGRRKPQST